MKIGYENKPRSLNLAAKMKDDLAMLSSSVNLSEVENVISSILNGEIDCAAYPMSRLPKELPKGLGIGGVSKRGEVAMTLVNNPNKKDATESFGLRQSGLVKGYYEGDLDQITNFNLTLKHEILTEKEEWLVHYLLAAFEEGNDALIQSTFDKLDCDAVLVEHSRIEENMRTKYEDYWIRFNPKELVPKAGTGVVAYLCATEDVITRGILKLIHHTDVSEVTNIERAIQKEVAQYGIKAAAHCQKDSNHYFHISIYGNSHRMNFSHSTKLEIVRTAVKRITDEER
jgi:hydroxymethylbilane synthase